MANKTRNYGDTFLYSKGGFEDSVYKFLMKSTRVDKNDKSFDMIRYEVKRRQIHKCVLDVLDNNNLVLQFDENTSGLPRSFKVFTCPDIRTGDRKAKTFIDVTGIISYKDGAYTVNVRMIDAFISYLIAAMCELIYYTDSNKLLNNTSIINESTTCFSKLFFYIIDYLRIGNVEKIKEKTLYLSARYYNECLLQKEGETVISRAKKISSLNQREIDILDLYIEPESFKNINTFVYTVSKALKDSKLDASAFVDKWRYLYGPSTFYATELFTVFSKMLTDTYVAAYLNQQKTIEKICGNSFIEYTKSLLRIGSELF